MAGLLYTIVFAGNSSMEKTKDFFITTEYDGDLYESRVDGGGDSILEKGIEDRQPLRH